MPGTTLLVLSVLVIDKSVIWTTLSVSVAELLAKFGSVTPAPAVTVAVLLRLPVADALTFAVTV